MKHTQEGNAMGSNFRAARITVLAVLVLATMVSAATLSFAADHKAQPQVTLAQLKGTWGGSFFGQTGCGVGATYITFTLDANGNGTGTAKEAFHTAGCGDGSGTYDFVVKSLNANGSGTAGLSCGSGCGFALVIQVSKNHQVMTLVDVTDPNNYLEGTVLHQ